MRFIDPCCNKTIDNCLLSAEHEKTAAEEYFCRCALINQVCIIVKKLCDTDFKFNFDFKVFPDIHPLNELAPGRSLHPRKELDDSFINNAVQLLTGVPGLAVTGRDVIAAGIAGPEVGQVLESLLEQVLNGSVSNSRETLLPLIEVQQVN